MGGVPAGGAVNQSSWPWVTAGGGFVFGLFGLLGVDSLFKSDKYAFALTVFGFVTCLILVVALATLDLKEIKWGDKTIPLGAYAVSALATLTFLIGLVGAGIFFTQFVWDTPVPALASFDTPVSMSDSGSLPKLKPLLYVDGTALALSDAPANTTVRSGSKLILMMQGLEAFETSYGSELKSYSDLQGRYDKLNRDYTAISTGNRAAEK